MKMGSKYRFQNAILLVRDISVTIGKSTIAGIYKFFKLIGRHYYSAISKLKIRIFISSLKCQIYHLFLMWASINFTHYCFMFWVIFSVSVCSNNTFNTIYLSIYILTPFSNVEAFLFRLYIPGKHKNYFNVTH